MVSQDKLIKQGINYTDKLFAEISKRLEAGVKASDTLEAFLDATKEYTAKNPLISSGYDETMLRLILQETNNHKFSRPSQKELARVTIENYVGDLIVDVGEDIKDSVREIVKDGYNNNLSQDEIADNISNRVSVIKNKRARAIARTEVARTATVSDYIINKERGATHWYVECRNTACPVCKERWHKNWSLEKDDNFNPSDTSAGGKGWIGDKIYSMDDTANLPPVHPNCRCVVYFINENDKSTKGTITEKPTTTTTTTTTEPTPGQLKKNLRPGEREKYNSYKRNIENQQKWLRENPNASAEDIAKHQKRLAFLQGKIEELRRKALGGKTGGTTAKPKDTAKPKTTPKTEKPKATPKPKAEKPKAETTPKETQKPTKDQLSKNLTKKELKEYNDILETMKWAKDVQNSKYVSAKGKENALKKVTELTPRFNELTQKALTGKSTKTTKRKSTAKKTKNKKEPKAEITVDKPKNARLTKEEADSMTFEQLAEHHGAEYKGLVKIAEDNNKEYHVFEQTFDNGETFKLHFEKSAVNSYKKEGIATANEIIHETFKVPVGLRKETNEIWFRNSQKSVMPNKKGTGVKSFAKNEGGHNVSKNRRAWKINHHYNNDNYEDPDHKIAINPKYFKKLKDFFDILHWRDRPEEKVSWKHALHHEFIHSIDTSREIWRNDLTRLSDTQQYRNIHDNEPYFTAYANTIRSESFAEHGGFISYMLANPDDHSKLLKIQVPKKDENGRTRIVEEQINFKQYKERYPLHYEYFVNLLKVGK